MNLKKVVLKPEIMQDAAAFLFWTMAENSSVAEVSDSVIETSGLCLFEQPSASQILSQYGYQNLTVDVQSETIKAIAAEAVIYCVEEKNMLGIIYSDDAETGRSPSSRNIPAELLKPASVPIIKSAHEVEKIGRLCLRHPLPAVVFTDKLPGDGFIEVADTSTALGFQTPIFMSNIGILQISDDTYVLTGIFHIPVPTVQQGDLWNMAIMNSTRFVSKMNYCSHAGDIQIDVQW